MRIFYINFDFPPIGGPGIWRAMAFVKYWREAGHEITVFCSDRSIWCDRVDESNLEKIPEDVSVFRLKSLLANDVKDYFTNKYQRTNSPILKKIYEGFSWRIPRLFPTHVFFWVLAVVINGLWQARKGRPDIIFSSGPTHDSHIANLVLSKILRAKMVIDYRDLWFDEDMESEKNQYRGIAHFFEKNCLKYADRVVAVSPAWLVHLHDKYSLNHQNSKFIVIYNGHDLPILSEIKSQNKNKKIHIHYNGTPQLNQFGIEFFQALKKVELKTEESNSIKITFSGMRGHFIDYVDQYRLWDIVEDAGVMSHADSVSFSRSSDVMIVAVDNGFKSYLGTIPGKTYEAMALGKHVFAVLPPGSDLEPILQEYGNYTLCSSKSVEEIVNGLLSLKDKLSEPQPVPAEGFLEKYSRKYQANKLLNEFEKLMGQ